MIQISCWLLLTVVTQVFVSYGAVNPYTDLTVFGYNPVANPGSVIVEGSARFTVLSQYVIRMEYDPDRVFEDRPTIMAVNRQLPKPSFSKSTGAVLTITTDKIKLQYATGQLFTPATLNVTQLEDNRVWRFGDIDAGNLLGTIKSLDGLCTVSLNCTENKGIYIHDESLHCGWGVVSRQGRTVIDDSNNYVMAPDWFSPLQKNKNTNDLYFFGHGNNYREALQDYVNIAGKAPMPKKSLLGSWYTRWYDFDALDVKRSVELFEDYGLPLDVLVLDMNWHTKNDWTGFTWDRTLFPQPKDTVDYLHSRNLLLAANIHDASGLGYWEDTYLQMCKINGIDPNGGTNVPFLPLNATYMHSLQDVTMDPTGIDFWWIDWQQGGKNGGCTGDALNPTIITDHVRGTNNIRTGTLQRDQVLARWGGMGSHRYPVGFSADVLALTWECMAFQPYFSVTAANVAYGYISHDLVGPANDNELTVRWMQFGAYSGVMRIHDRGMSAGDCWGSDTCAVVNMWKLPEKYFRPIRAVMRARVALLPYIYTYTRKAYDTGVSTVYPMYYDYPQQDNAYLLDSTGKYAQYMFGSQIIVSPICFPADSSTGLASKQTWLPQGTWYDDVYGDYIQISNASGKLLTRAYEIGEVPLFLQGIVPRLANPAKIGVAKERFTNLDVYLYLTSQSEQFAMYDDDGTTYDYVKEGSKPVVTFSYTLSSGTLTFSLTGDDDKNSKLQRLRIVIVGSAPILSAKDDDGSIPYRRFDNITDTSYFSYDAFNAHAYVVLPNVSGGKYTLTIQLQQIQGSFNSVTVSRLKGFAHRAQLAKRTMDNYRTTPYSTTVGPGYLKQTGGRIDLLSFLAAPKTAQSHFVPEFGNYSALIQKAITEIQSPPSPPPSPPPFHGLVQMWDFNRKDMVLCGSLQCISANNFYMLMWVEGYQPASSSGDAVPLIDYWSGINNDNYATTNTTAPSTYGKAIFENGYVVKTSAGGRRCLQVWYSSGYKDYMTTASEEGALWAKVNNYNLVDKCVGYVLDSIESGTQGNENLKSWVQQYMLEEHARRGFRATSSSFRTSGRRNAHKKPSEKTLKDVDPSTFAVHLLQSILQ